MEENITSDISSTSLILKIKKEPKDEPKDERFDFENKESQYHITRSLVLRFIRDKNGEYSVVPLIKPDPFFEEHLDDFNCEDSGVTIKSEEGEDPYLDKDENDNFKQDRDVPHEDKYSVDQVDTIKTKSRVQEEDKTKETDILSHCPICCYSNTKILLKRHMQRVHSSITKYSCPFCNKKNFREPLSVDCHIFRNHKDIKGALGRIRRTIFRCTFCRYKTLKRNNYTRHLTTHGESRLKKHMDSIGDKRSLLASKSEMKRALSSTKYDCFYCPYTTKDKGSIIKHLRRHRGAKHLPFSCKECNKNFNEKNSLDSHIIKRHLDNAELLRLVTNRVYECELCEYKDVNKNKVIRHKKRHVKKERKRKNIRSCKIKLQIVKKH